MEKRKSLKFNLVLIMLLIASICIAFLLNSKQNAYAEPLVTGTFEMEDGVSLKLNEDGGMRFRVKMNEDVKKYIVDNDTANAVSLGFVIAQTSKITEIRDGDGNYRSLTNNTAEVVESKIYKEGDFWYANGCITNMYEQNRKADYSAVAFIKNGEEVQYTPYNDNARNNFYYASQYALLNDYTDDILALDSYAWLGKGDFPIVVSDSSEYDLVVDKVNAGYDFSAMNLKVENDVQPTKAYTESNVPFVNGAKNVDLSSWAVGDGVAWTKATETELTETGMTGEAYKFTATTDSDKLGAGIGASANIGLLSFGGYIVFDLYVPAEYMANNVICLAISNGQLANLKYERAGITYVRSNNTVTSTIIADEILKVVIDISTLGAPTDNYFLFSCGADINEYYVSNFALYSEYDISNLEKAILMQNFTGIAPAYLTWEKATDGELTATGMSGDVFKLTALKDMYSNTVTAHQTIDGLSTSDKLLVFDLYLSEENTANVLILVVGSAGVNMTYNGYNGNAKYIKQDGTVLYEVVAGELLKVVLDLKGLGATTDKFEISAVTPGLVAYVGNMEFVDAYPAA